MKKTFLQAEWRKLIIVNYRLDPRLLEKYLPYKTELDFWQGQCFVSLVGFMFLNTKLKGIRVPFHSNFEEVNLRFYVKHREHGIYKRGVVFIKEVVPKHAITLVANTLYGEHYETLPMAHSWSKAEGNSLAVEYRWKKENWHSVGGTAQAASFPIREGSKEEFITQHFWGYTKLGDRKTSEYEVAHPRWNVYPVQDYSVQVDFEVMYGRDFSCLDGAVPASVFLAEGSEILVKEGGVIG